MTSQERRLQRARELAQQAEEACERCGSSLLPGAEKPTEYVVTWDDGEIWEEDDPAEDEEVFCEACGKQRIFTIKWDDAGYTPPHVVEWIERKREEARARELLDGLGFGGDGEER